jgi:hypothetical protein
MSELENKVKSYSGIISERVRSVLDHLVHTDPLISSVLVEEYSEQVDLTFTVTHPQCLCNLEIYIEIPVEPFHLVPGDLIQEMQDILIAGIEDHEVGSLECNVGGSA